MGKYPIWVCPFLLLLLTCLERSIALTEGEETTILDFYQTWPALAHLSPPWSPNASIACDNPPFQGLECSEGPEKHIIGLYVVSCKLCSNYRLDANSKCSITTDQHHGAMECIWNYSRLDWKSGLAEKPVCWKFQFKSSSRVPRDTNTGL